MEPLPRTTRYQRNIAAGLDRALRQALTPDRPAELSEIRFIVFSDHHRTDRGRSDDFRICEPAYSAALGWYLEQGHHLLLLGDVEELWTTHPDKVISSYRAVMDLEGAFMEEDRLWRFWGNHDDLWQQPGAVAHWLEPVYGPHLRMIEGMRIEVTAAGKRLGTLFFTHGHQGEFFSDRYGLLGQWGSQTFLRPWKRVTRAPSVTPAGDNRLRKRHNIAMYLWALRHPGTVLIAGHTHKPVFLTRENTERMEQQLAERRQEPGWPSSELARSRAEIEWIKAEQRLQCEEVEEELRPLTPCYFNTGCCSFRDGDVTGLEVADGKIRLVRWPDDHKQPRPKTLVEASLADVLTEVTQSAPTRPPCA
jgi:predicted phosphodiesterase